jgi:hypothetical protein
MKKVKKPGPILAVSHRELVQIGGIRLGEEGGGYMLVAFSTVNRPPGCT